MSAEPRPPFIEAAITVTTGATFDRWCDECLVSHMFVEVYTLLAHGPEVRHVGTWGDHNDAEGSA